LLPRTGHDLRQARTRLVLWL